MIYISTNINFMCIFIQVYFFVKHNNHYFVLAKFHFGDISRSILIACCGRSKIFMYILVTCRNERSLAIVE